MEPEQRNLKKQRIYEQDTYLAFISISQSESRSVDAHRSHMNQAKVKEVES